MAETEQDAAARRRHEIEEQKHKDELARIAAEARATRDKKASAWALGGAMFFVALSLIGLIVLSFKIIALANDQIDPLRARFLLAAVALFISVAFAAMGFGLFLIGAQGTFKSGGQTQKEASWLPAFEAGAPGLVLIVCATVVVYLALRADFPNAAVTGAESSTDAGRADAGSALDAGARPDGGT